MVVGGAALARDANGRVVFVSGALPNEAVAVEYRSSKKDFATADVIEVLEASVHRVEPPCEAWHRGCGGCDWQHIDPAAQLMFKTEMVREALTRTARIDSPGVVAGASGSPWAYRTTVRVAVDPSGGVGFRSRRSHDVVVIASCPVAAHPINDMLTNLRAANTAEVTLRVGLASGMATAWGAPDSIITGVDDDVLTTGDSVVYEDVRGCTLRVSAASFFQSSPDAAGLLVDAVARATADLDLSTCTVIDAYGGVGLFAATVAREAVRVVVVESSSAACADARYNLRHISAHVVESRVEHWQPEPADLVIADPARSGLDRAAIERLVATGASRLVLVSCDAGSLARDARLLRDHGYRHVSTEVFDVFVNTSHIETVSRFDHVPRAQ